MKIILAVCMLVGIVSSRLSWSLMIVHVELSTMSDFIVC